MYVNTKYTLRQTCNSNSPLKNETTRATKNKNNENYQVEARWRVRVDDVCSCSAILSTLLHLKLRYNERHWTRFRASRRRRGSAVHSAQHRVSGWIMFKIRRMATPLSATNLACCKCKTLPMHAMHSLSPSSWYMCVCCLSFLFIILETKVNSFVYFTKRKWENYFNFVVQKFANSNVKK